MGNGLKGSVAAASAKFRARRKARPAPGAGDHAGRGQGHAGSAAKTAALRWRQPAGGRGLKLGLNDLLICVRAYFDHALVIFITGMGHAQNVLTRRNRFQDDSSRSADTAVAFVINVDFRARGRHDYQTRFAFVFSLRRVVGRLLEFSEPAHYARRTFVRVLLERVHH